MSNRFIGNVKETPVMRLEAYPSKKGLAPQKPPRPPKEIGVSGEDEGGQCDQSGGIGKNRNPCMKLRGPNGDRARQLFCS